MVYNSKYYKANTERYKEASEKWRKANQTKVNEAYRKNYAKNEEYRKRKLLKMKEYRAMKKLEKMNALIVSSIRISSQSTTPFLAMYLSIIPFK